MTILCGSFIAQAQTDLPLVKTEYLTEYEKGKVISPKKLVAKVYGDKRLERTVNLESDPSGKSYYEMHHDEKERLTKLIFVDEIGVMGFETIYQNGEILMDIYNNGDDSRADTTLHVYEDGKLVALKKQRNGWYVSIDSMFYEDTTLVRSVEQGFDGYVLETSDYRYNTKKGLIYEKTSYNTEDSLTTRVTKTYTSHHKVKSEKTYIYDAGKKTILADKATFHKYNYDGLTVKIRTYNYLEKKVEKLIYKYDDQGRMIEYRKKSPKDKTMSVHEFVYE